MNWHRILYAVTGRDSRRLPGDLCDETPPTAVDRSRCTRCDRPVILVRMPAVGLQWMHNTPTADGHLPVFDEQPAPDAPAEDPATTVERLRRELKRETELRRATEHLLAEVTGDRDALERANGRILARERACSPRE